MHYNLYTCWITYPCFKGLLLQSPSLHNQLKSLHTKGYYFDSYRLHSSLASILRFLKRNCITWDYNRSQLQGLTADTCGRYACLFAIFMNRKHTPVEYVIMFTQQPNVQTKMSTRNGALCRCRYTPRLPVVLQPRSACTTLFFLQSRRRCRSRYRCNKFTFLTPGTTNTLVWGFS